MTGLPRWPVVKNPPANAGNTGSVPGPGRSPGEGNGTLLQYPCPEKSHGQRSLEGYGPCGHKRVGHHLATTQRQTPQHDSLCNSQGVSFLESSVQTGLLWNYWVPFKLLCCVCVCVLELLLSWTCQAPDSHRAGLLGLSL